MLVLIDRLKIKMMREELLITASELAELAGVSRATVYNMESGRHERVQIGTLRKVAVALGSDPRDLRITVQHVA